MQALLYNKLLRSFTLLPAEISNVLPSEPVLLNCWDNSVMMKGSILRILEIASVNIDIVV